MNDQNRKRIPTDPSTPSRKVEDGEDITRQVLSGSPAPLSLNASNEDFEEDAAVYDEEGNCYRRYLNRTRNVDIPYYNTTVGTRLLTAICLEGIRCNPEDDNTRCKILHAKCNENIDTASSSFQMRVTLSECTVEDTLCHLGHQTPVMCCQDQYSQGIESSANHTSNDISKTIENSYNQHKDELATIFNNKTDAKEENELNEDTFLFLGDISNANHTNIINTITENILMNSESILQAIDGNEDGTLNVNNEILAIITEFVVVIDPSKSFNQSSGDNTVLNILNNLKANASDFKTLFDRETTAFGVDEDLNPDGKFVLDIIRNQINEAVGNVDDVGTNNICIKNIDEDKVTELKILNITEHTAHNESKPSMILIESKNDVIMKINQCQKAIDCNEPISCIFAQGRCLQRSGIDILPTETRLELAKCKINSLHCTLGSRKIDGQGKCSEQFSNCAALLRVEIYEGTVVNVVNPELSVQTTIAPGIVKNVLKNITDALSNELGNASDIEIVAINKTKEKTIPDYIGAQADIGVPLTLRCDLPRWGRGVVSSRVIKVLFCKESLCVAANKLCENLQGSITYWEKLFIDLHPLQEPKNRKQINEKVIKQKIA